MMPVVSEHASLPVPGLVLPEPQTDTQRAISTVCREVEQTLIEKNRAYGNSAIDPVRIFSSADSREQLLVRIDDKLSRIARGGEMGEDVVLDLIGYLVLLRVHDRTAGVTHDAEYEAEKADMLGRLQPHAIDVEQVRPGRGPRRSED